MPVADLVSGYAVTHSPLEWVSIGQRVWPLLKGPNSVRTVRFTMTWLSIIPNTSH